MTSRHIDQHSLNPLVADFKGVSHNMAYACSSAAVDDAATWIVEIARARNRDCFIALFQNFAPKVKTYLLRQGVRAEAAEELTQEVFLTIWRKADLFDPARANASTWIYTIARNRWFDRLRRERHPDDGRIDEQPQAQQTPEEELKAMEGETRVRAALHNLPPEQADVLRMSYFDEKSHVEIADDLGLPLGTVKSRIRLATAHLRVALEDLS